MINLDFYLQNFKKDASIITTLLSSADEAEIKWKPGKDKWNLLEIACHLRDEEKEDFRARLQNTLEDPERHWTRIDPKKWPAERSYGEQELNQVLAAFNKEREDSISWLASLREPDWNREHVHPSLGPMSAMRIIANWLAHDHLHIRQILKLKYEYLKHIAGQDLSYAGSW